MRVGVVIPVLNEEGNLGPLIHECTAADADLVVVADNGSTDDSSLEAEEAGALVVHEARRGYGYACAAGASATLEHGAEVLVFIDGDRSSVPSEMRTLLAPILNGTADLVLGSRSLGTIAPGAMPAHQRFGNWLSARLMRRLYGVVATDLSPYRAIRADLFVSLEMTEMTFGWPTEMMVKSANASAKLMEVPVSWLPRAEGRSKVSGTLKGSVLAARHIIGVTVRNARNRSSIAPYRRTT
jgi:glycosyltransferase involved in cell wall biosynthesis